MAEMYVNNRQTTACFKKNEFAVSYINMTSSDDIVLEDYDYDASTITPDQYKDIWERLGMGVLVATAREEVHYNTKGRWRMRRADYIPPIHPDDAPVFASVMQTILEEAIEHGEYYWSIVHLVESISFGELYMPDNLDRETYRKYKDLFEKHGIKRRTYTIKAAKRN